jgi:hypothetical protein
MVRKQSNYRNTSKMSIIDEKKEQGGMVTFRLKGPHFKKLDAWATRAGTPSHHLHAQAIVESVLDDRDQEMMFLRHEVTELRAELEAIKGGLVAILATIMRSTSKGTLTSAQADFLVQKAFERKDGG